MPELPEVEHIARGLDALLPDHTIRAVSINWDRTIATHTLARFGELVCGHTFRSVQRRGKYLILELPPHYLLIHLRMTGRLFFCNAPESTWETDPHVHVTIQLDDDARLYFRDVRKFGRFFLVDDPEKIVGSLGPEPLSPAFTINRLASILHGHKRQIKPLLLDQQIIAGLGNIYVDEALWKANIHPLQRSHTLNCAQIERLHQRIRQVLQAAISHGGTTLRDYRGASDEPGEHQYALAVYGQTGEPCPRCGTPIARIKVAQRGTHYCPDCQTISEEHATDGSSAPSSP